MKKNIFEALFKKKKPDATDDRAQVEGGEATSEESELDQVEGERALPSVNKSTSINTKMTNAITIMGVVALGLFVMYRYYSGLLDEKRRAAAEKGVDMTQQAEVQLPPLKKPAELEAEAQPPTLLDAPPPPPENPRGGSGGTHVPPAASMGGGPGAGGGSSAAQQAYGPDGQPIPSPEEEAKERKRKSSVAFKVEGGDGVAVQRAPEIRTASAGAAGDGRDDALADALKPTYTPGVKASVLPDRDLFITKGTFLDCVIEQAIDTKLPGMLSCLLSHDVYGTSGNVVLLDKGTKLTGEYSSEIKGNDARIFVLWSLAETPTGVVVELNSAGTDPLGRAGIGGVVDNHFRERFGAALLVSIIEDTSDAIAQRQANKAQASGGTAGTAVVLPNTTKNTTSLATDVLRQDIDIPATLNKNQGSHISVYVARHLDFRGVYKLEKRSRKR